MTRLRSTFGPVLMLAALAAVAVPVAASAASSKGPETRVVGRVTAITSTGLTVGNSTFTASSRTLDGLTTGQCVELRTERRAGVPRVTRIKAEDSCRRATTTTGTTTTQTTPTTAGGADDPANHDAGDTTGGADDPANQHAGDDHGHHGGGSDD